MASLARDPQRAAFFANSRKSSIGDLAQRAAAVRDFLVGHDVKPGDRVILCMDGLHAEEWMACYFGIHLLGAWCVPLNPKAVAANATFFIEDLEPTAILTATDGVAAWGQTGIDARRIIAVDFADSSVRAVVDGRAWPLNLSSTVKSAEKEEGGDLIYTTGTTGRPKGVILPSDIEFETGRRYAVAQTLERGKVIHSPIPLFTASAIMTLVLPIIATDAAFSIDGTFSPALSLDKARAAGCNVFKAVPSHYLLIGNEAQVEPLESVRLAITTAAPLSATGYGQIKRLFPNAEIMALFGSTESAGAFTIISQEQLQRSLGSLGTPIEECKIELRNPVINETGEEEGDLVLRGSVLAAGYWRRDASVVEATFIGGGVRTGDRATRVGDDFVLGGRTSSVINRGGLKIDPAEIESVINVLSWVEDSCVLP
ncbi:class I adenylate-forming enzyme family protein, partial [Pseudorhodoplanes sp.]|uniref:class I adenylate-forming enzyme family protein n=1 Tax=Pseudorhodoplanes sp. TaxID=1934341 RepID=UPI003D0D8312